jgi:hypothetical protein
VSTKEKFGETIFKTDFKDLMYQGKPILPDVNAETHTMYYRHIYRVNYEGTWRKHMCLQSGAWCWQQSRRHPIEAFQYLIRKIKK